MDLFDVKATGARESVSKQPKFEIRSVLLSPPEIATVCIFPQVISVPFLFSSSSPFGDDGVDAIAVVKPGAN